MFSRCQDSKLQQLLSIQRNSRNPFSNTVEAQQDSILATIHRFGFGAIVSGGQTGVDTAAFRTADDFKIPKMGFAPRGYINEAGRIREEFSACMQEPDGVFGTLTPEEIAIEEKQSPYARTALYAERTRLNARYSCATLILSVSESLSNGTQLTFDAAVEAHGRDRVFTVDLTRELPEQMTAARWWLFQNPAVLLNVAGPRESATDETSFSVCTRSMEALRLLIEG
jgi:hypothetical protein